MNCNRCGSGDIISGVRVVDRGEDWVRSDLSLELVTAPNKIFDKGRVSAPVTADICCACGNVMMTLDRTGIEELRNAYRTIEMLEKVGDPGKHPRFADYLKEDACRKSLSKKDQMLGFSDWLARNG